MFMGKAKVSRYTMQVLITGGTGLLGQQIAKTLQDQGHQVLVVSRNAERAKKSGACASAFIEGDLTKGPLAHEKLQDVEAVIHLMGESIVQKRWDAKTKKRLRDSRILSTTHLRKTPLPRLRVVVSASAVGIYGDRGDAVLTETSAPAQDFLGQLCQDWEREVLALASEHVRCVCLRLGVVVSRHGGALATMLPAFRLGLGGPLGGGQGWMSWIHLEDACAAFVYALMTPTLTGPVNASSPQPVRNKLWTQTLAQQLHRPAWIPIPAWGLRALLGEMSCVALASQRVQPQKLLTTGFEFKYPALLEAFSHTLQA